MVIEQNRKPWSRPMHYGNLIYDRGSSAIIGGKKDNSINCPGTVSYPQQKKNVIGSLPHINPR